jgi:hypothetical protein
VGILPAFLIQIAGQMPALQKWDAPKLSGQLDIAELEQGINTVIAMKSCGLP